MNRKRIIMAASVAAAILLLTASALAYNVFRKESSRFQSFSEGFSFEAGYAVSMSEDAKKNHGLLNLMDMSDMLSGTMRGESGNGILHASIIPEKYGEPITEFYSDGDAVYFNVREIYELFRGKLCESKPIAGALIPKWSAGAYLATEQIETLIGQPIRMEMLETRDFFALDRLKKISYPGGKDGYLYFELADEVTGKYRIIIGMKKSGIYEGPVDVDLILSQGEEYQIRLDAHIEAGEQAIAMPDDYMTEGEVESLRKLLSAAGWAVDLVLGNARR